MSPSAKILMIVDNTLVESVFLGPVTVSGDVVRVISEPGGAGRIEIWEKGSGWVRVPPGRIRADELIPGAYRPVSVRDRARLGMPASEL
jgi:hypothetical protein